MDVERSRKTLPSDDHVDDHDRAGVGDSHLPDPGSVGSGPEDAPGVGRGALAAAGLAGLTYFAAGWVTFPDGPTMATASADQIRAHVAASGGAIQVAAFAGMLGVGAALILVPALVRQVRDRLPGSLLADVVLAAGILVIVYQWLMVTAEGMLRLFPNLLDSVVLAGVDDGTVQGWYGLTGFTHFLGDLAIVPMMLMIAAFSLAARRGHLLPSWLVWVGLIIVGLGCIGAVGIIGEVAALYPLWFAGLFGYFLWILSTSVTFLNRLRRPRQQTVID